MLMYEMVFLSVVYHHLVTYDHLKDSVFLIEGLWHPRIITYKKRLVDLKTLSNIHWSGNNPVVYKQICHVACIPISKETAKYWFSIHRGMYSINKCFHYNVDHHFNRLEFGKFIPIWNEIIILLLKNLGIELKGNSYVFISF